MSQPKGKRYYDCLENEWSCDLFRSDHFHQVTDPQEPVDIILGSEGDLLALGDSKTTAQKICVDEKWSLQAFFQESAQHFLGDNQGLGAISQLLLNISLDQRSSYRLHEILEGAECFYQKIQRPELAGSYGDYFVQYLLERNLPSLYFREAYHHLLHYIMELRERDLGFFPVDLFLLFDQDEYALQVGLQINEFHKDYILQQFDPEKESYLKRCSSLCYGFHVQEFKAAEKLVMTCVWKNDHRVGNFLGMTEIKDTVPSVQAKSAEVLETERASLEGEGELQSRMVLVRSVYLPKRKFERLDRAYRHIKEQIKANEAEITVVGDLDQYFAGDVEFSSLTKTDREKILLYLKRKNFYEDHLQKYEESLDHEESLELLVPEPYASVGGVAISEDILEEMRFVLYRIIEKKFNEHFLNQYKEKIDHDENDLKMTVKNCSIEIFLNFGIEDKKTLFRFLNAFYPYVRSTLGKYSSAELKDYYKRDRYYLELAKTALQFLSLECETSLEQGVSADLVGGFAKKGALQYSQKREREKNMHRSVNEIMDKYAQWEEQVHAISELVSENKLSKAFLNNLFYKLKPQEEVSKEEVVLKTQKEDESGDPSQQLRMELLAAHKEIKKQGQSIAELETELNAFRNQAEEVKNPGTSVAATDLADLQAEIKSLKEKHQLEIKRLQKSYEENAQAMSEIQNEKPALPKEESFSDKIQNYEDQLGDYQKKIKELEHKLKVANNVADNVEKQEKEKNNNQDLKTKHKIKQLEKKVELLEKEKKKIEKSLSESKRDLVKSRQDLVGAKNKLKQNEAELAKLKKRLDQQSAA